jgi:hypothetical protein
MRTLADVMDLTISWEETLRDLYSRFAKGFPTHPEIARFWQTMAIAESTHASLLRKTRAVLSPASLSVHLDDRHTEAFEAAALLMSRVSSAGIDTLEDAYELAHEIEGSEVNVLFCLLTSRLDDSSRSDLISAQFDEHIDALSRFGGTHSKSFRVALLFDPPVGE